jgi:putative nucleotidyltransferase with HDIG domain
MAAIGLYTFPRMKTREDALALLYEFTKTDSLRKHAVAVEQAMKACARKYAPAEDPVRWGMCGLLHDFDYEMYPNADQHPYVGSRILEERGFDEELRHAIMGHAPYTNVPRDSLMARGLFACDELCGFLVACALVQPSKSIADVKPASVKKKLKDKAFARSVSRADIHAGVEELGVDLEEHIAFVREALLEIADQIGVGGKESTPHAV